MQLMRLKRRMTVTAYGPLGTGSRETLEAGEFAMLAGPVRDDGTVDAMTMAGLIRVRPEDLEPDRGQPVPA